MRTTFPVDAPPEAWVLLADPAVLVASLPGCRSAVPVSGDGGGLRIMTEVSVASVRGLWVGTVERVDDDAVRVTGSGEPGAVDLVVRADPARTTLTVDGSVDGPLARVGSAVVEAAVRRLARDLLAAATAPASGPPPAEHATPVDAGSRGNEFRFGEVEVMGSGSGTHDLDLDSSEPMTSGGTGSSGAVAPAASPVADRGRRGRTAAAVVAGAAIVVAVARRLARRRGT